MSIQSTNPEIEIEIIEEISNLFVCCFCSQMINLKSFMDHYANCKEVFTPEVGFTPSINAEIKGLDKKISIIFQAYNSNKNCLINILEYNKIAKWISCQLVCLITKSPSSSKSSDNFNDRLESCMTTNNSMSLVNTEPVTRKKVKTASLNLKRLAEDEIKVFNALN